MRMPEQNMTARPKNPRFSHFSDFYHLGHKQMNLFPVDPDTQNVGSGQFLRAGSQIPGKAVMRDFVAFCSKGAT